MLQVCPKQAKLYCVSSHSSAFKSSMTLVTSSVGQPCASTSCNSWDDASAQPARENCANHLHRL
eukprot:548792-Amphidinium_carterae.1